MDLCVGQDGDRGRNRAAGDFPQEHSTRRGLLAQVQRASCRPLPCWSRKRRRLRSACSAIRRSSTSFGGSEQLHYRRHARACGHFCACAENIAPVHRVRRPPLQRRLLAARYLPLPPRWCHPFRRTRRTKTRASGIIASASTARRPTTSSAGLHLEGTHFPAVPCRSGAAEFLCAASLFLFVFLAGSGRSMRSNTGPSSAMTSADPTVPNM